MIRTYLDGNNQRNIRKLKKKIFYFTISGKCEEFYRVNSSECFDVLYHQPNDF